MQEAPCRGVVVFAFFNREDVTETRNRGETGCFIVAANALISYSTDPRFAAF